MFLQLLGNIKEEAEELNFQCQVHLLSNQPHHHPGKPNPNLQSCDKGYHGPMSMKLLG